MPDLSLTRARAATAAAVAVLALLLVLAAAAAAAAQAAAIGPQARTAAVTATDVQAGVAPPVMTCTAEPFPIILGSASTVMTGHLCTRASPAGKTLIFAVPGATYDWHYWDWPDQQDHYSFAWAATLAGFDVLCLDEPGTPPQDGKTGYPPATDVVVPRIAAAVHQVISAVSSGAIQGIRFPAAILAGHSFGSAISLTEAATFHDPSIKGVDLTGLTHTVNGPGQATAQNGIHAAQDDPKFAHDKLPPLYVTSKPGTRGTDFYDLNDASARVIKEDESLKSTTTMPELTGMNAALVPALSKQIGVPVDEVVGQHDLLFCGTAAPCSSAATVHARESTDFSAAAHLQVAVLPGAGHSINLAENAPLGFVQEITWMLHLPGVTSDVSNEWLTVAGRWTAQHAHARSS